MSVDVDFTSERGSNRYGATVDHLTQESYVRAAQQVLSRMSRAERQDLVSALRASAREQDVNEPGLHDIQSLDDPNTLGGLFGNLRLNSPGLLEQLLDETPFYDTVFGGMAELTRR